MTINKDITGKIAGIALVCLVSVSVPGTQPENRVTVVYGAEEEVRYSLSSTANVTPLIMVHFIDVGQGDAILDGAIDALDIDRVERFIAHLK